MLLYIILSLEIAPSSAVARVAASFSPFFSPSELKADEELPTLDTTTSTYYPWYDAGDDTAFEKGARGVSSPGEHGVAALDYDLKENYDPFHSHTDEMLRETETPPAKNRKPNSPIASRRGYSMVDSTVPATPFRVMFDLHNKHSSIVTGSGPAGRFCRKKNGSEPLYQGDCI